MTPRRGLIVVLVAAIAAIELGVPAIALVGDRPARFGWQMYSGVNPAPEAWVEDPAGERHAVDLRALIADTRAEIEWAAPLAEHLCGERDAVAVVVADREGTVRIPCP